MTRPRVHSARSRAAALGALALFASLAACERQLPTSAEISAMDAVAAESHLEQLMLLTPGSEVVIYYLDGVQVSATQAHSLAAERITQIEVTRGDEAGATRIQLRSRGGDGPHLSVAADTLRALPLLHREVGAANASAFTGLIIINGVPSPPAALRALRRGQIESVEIIKGEAAAHMYDDPRAAQGVIRISTREDTAPR